jgi:hypothetical protein
MFKDIVMPMVKEKRLHHVAIIASEINGGITKVIERLSKIGVKLITFYS